MTMNPKSRRCLARCLRRFSTGHARARANLELSSQTIQEPSLFNIGCSDRIHSLMHTFSIDPGARSHSHDSSTPSAAKSP